MFKTPAEYAKQLLALCYGKREQAMIELIVGARDHATVPAKFFADVVAELLKE